MILKPASTPSRGGGRAHRRESLARVTDLEGRPRGGGFSWRGAGAFAAVGAPLGRRRHIGAFQNLCRSGWPVSPDIQHQFHDGVRHARSGAGRKPPAASTSRRGDRKYCHRRQAALKPARATAPMRSRRCAGFTPRWWKPPCRRMISSCLRSRTASANNTGPRRSCTRRCSACDRPTCLRTGRRSPPTRRRCRSRIVSRSAPPPATSRSRSFRAAPQDCAYPDGIAH